MICSICGAQKQSVAPKVSSLMNNVTLLLCDSCKEKKYEPRHFIVIAGRSRGAAAVRDYIVNRRYLGDEITAHELTP